MKRQSSTLVVLALVVAAGAVEAQAAARPVTIAEGNSAERSLSVTAFDTLVRERISGRTAIYGEGVSRWQVEYTAPDGALYIWNPWADATLTGRWRVRTAHLRDAQGVFDQVQVCYTFADTHDDAGGLRLGEEKCSDARYPLGLTGKMPSEWRKGDQFGLAAGVLPKKGAPTARPAWP